MEPTPIGALPDEIQDWRGTAVELAEQCNKLFPNIGLADEAGSANERLVRHYVQVGILTPPEREGREALFGGRQVAEFLAARRLIHDGWSLAKIAELIQTAGPDGFIQLVPAERAPTLAEQTLARLRSPAGRPSRVAERSGDSLSASRAPDLLPSDELWSSSFASPSSEPLLAAQEISLRRLDLQKNLTELGNVSGAPERRRTIRISLTPWCQVYVDARDLARMPADTPEILGNALTQALHEERIRKGK
jgi:DNA-binding transcriptional MerR regulator